MLFGEQCDCARSDALCAVHQALLFYISFIVEFAKIKMTVAERTYNVVPGLVQKEFCADNTLHFLISTIISATLFFFATVSWLFL